MVLAYALTGARPSRHEAMRVVGAVETIEVPDLFCAELGNVVWKLVRAKQIDLAEGLGIFDDAMGLVTDVVPAAELWAQAVVLAVDRDHPVYDTMFVALAASRGTRLVTYDRRLRQRFPKLTVAPSTMLRR